MILAHELDAPHRRYPPTDLPGLQATLLTTKPRAAIAGPGSVGLASDPTARVCLTMSIRWPLRLARWQS